MVHMPKQAKINTSNRGLDLLLLIITAIIIGLVLINIELNDLKSNTNFYSIAESIIISFVVFFVIPYKFKEKNTIYNFKSKKVLLIGNLLNTILSIIICIIIIKLGIFKHVAVVFLYILAMIELLVYCALIIYIDKKIFDLGKNKINKRKKKRIK